MIQTLFAFHMFQSLHMFSNVLHFTEANESVLSERSVLNQD